MTELLSPAGNFEKMKAALRYGADAVYLAGTCFGMRAAADNFSIEEIYEAVAYAHALGKKVYLAVNTLPHWEEFDALEQYLDDLSGAGLDAAIVADPGVLTLVKERLPETAIHMSTQAGCVSHRDCTFWQKQGASRIVLARELSFADIAEIRGRISKELELETFIHGSMCVSFSSRCMLSENLIGRDANRGRCAQPCRWNYNLFEISEEKRPETRFPVMENELGTFIMSSKDMCMIEHIPEMVRSGVLSFKIEGRMKSAYYAAVTANAYRMALDAYLRDPEGYVYDPAWLSELESVSHREYCTGYFFESPHSSANLTANTGYIREKAYLAVAIGYDPATGRATFRQKNKTVAGEWAELITPGSVGRPYLVSDMRSEEGEPIESAPHPNMIFTVQSDVPVREGDILRGAN
ncbi:MAG: U32 family peptidase [Ruminococcaceae bacterium]|nr:U32 family peptidase [Oscillospiraceae bacterium]